MSGQFFIFEESLAACTARRDRFFGEGAVGGTGGNGYAQEACLRILSAGKIACGALGAEARREGGIFLIGTAHDLTIVKGNCGADRETAIWRIGAIGCEPGFLDKDAVGLGELGVVIVDSYGDGDEGVFHACSMAVILCLIQI